MMKFSAALAAVSAATMPFSVAQSGAAAPDEPTLVEVRTATKRFRDVNVALAEGYIRDPMNICDTAPMMGFPATLGAMGIHYFRPDLLGITEPPNPRVDGNGVQLYRENPNGMFAQFNPNVSCEAQVPASAGSSMHAAAH